MSDGYRLATRAFAALMIAFGLAIVVVTLANGGGPLSYGIVLGLAFCALGAGRLYLARGGER